MRHILLAMVVFTVPKLSFAQSIEQLTDVKNWRTVAAQNHLMKPHSAKRMKLTIHYTGVKKNPNRSLKDKLNGLVRFSAQDKIKLLKADGSTYEKIKEPWGDMPYHYYIDANGQLAQGRDPKFRPDTNTEYDPDGHITIVVEGGPGEEMSAEQREKLFAAMTALQNKYKIPDKDVGTHKHHAHTSCPGDSVEGAVKDYLAARKKTRQIWGASPTPAPTVTPRAVPVAPSLFDPRPISGQK